MSTVWMGEQIKGIVRQAAAWGLLEGAQVAKEASLAMVPRETGALADSAYVDVDPDTLISIVGYDEVRDVKTIKEHEDLTYKHPRGGQAKFLEIPVKQCGNSAAMKLASRLRGVLS